MTQEEKELLLKDLCARLPYGVKVKNRRKREPVTLSLDVMTYFLIGCSVKPYLRPMSSMTEEEKKELKDLCDITPYETQGLKVDEYGIGVFLNGVCGINYDVVDWLNAHHFDYRRLIEKGLALEAPKDMYNTKTE